MHYRITVILAGLIFFCSAATKAQDYSKKLALVIGNAAYQHGGELKNPVNDARTMAETLRQLGFEVMLHENVSQNQMKQAINGYGIKLRGYDVGLFYYAGHGIQHKGVNYMIPVEADLQAAEQIEFDCVAADRVLAYMDAASTKVNLLIMDACRNNPFERSWHRSGTGNGLAMMDAPKGTLIAYATAPGKVAADGEGSNGLYTSALLKYLKDPDLNVEQIFKKVRTEVAEKSFGAQVPWETTSLTGEDFYFATQKRAAKPFSITGTATPELIKASYQKADALFEKGAYPESIDELTKIIALDQYHIKSYMLRANAYMMLMQHQKAIPDLNKVVELSPGEADGYYYRGLCRYTLKEIHEAIVDFTLTIRYNPDHSNAYYWRAYCYFLIEKNHPAIEDYNKTLALTPDNSEVYYYRGLSYFELEDFTAAENDFTRATERMPDMSEAHFRLGWCYHLRNEPEKAIATYSKAITLNPSFKEAYYYRAKAYHKLNRKTEAKRDIEKALELDPGNTEYISFWKTLAN
ncbi:MAG TPA: tetratricopeptide repeat protein [Cyclobacteriaceae bacterium]|nr:tetratricopeptide repeat protein [Cyclobacteriaceae bacterium]HRJ82043.1 tetratricopeptide repeat protein [Cyclobacteriaceae bacterium]